MSAIKSWGDVAEQTLVPGFRAKFIHSPNMTFAMVEADANSLLPEHQHHHEQVTHLLEGSLELVVNKVPHKMKPGDVVVIPSLAPHSAKALENCRILDVFNPQREDYAQGDFTVAQHKK
jgi:quercetin dioxygenase-like cupin family protein